MRISFVLSPVISTSTGGTITPLLVPLSTKDDTEVINVKSAVPTGISGLNMNGVLGHDSALKGYAGPGTTWPDEISGL